MLRPKESITLQIAIGTHFMPPGLHHATLFTPYCKPLVSCFVLYGKTGLQLNLPIILNLKDNINAVLKNLEDKPAVVYLVL